MILFCIHNVCPSLLICYQNIWCVTDIIWTKGLILSKRMCSAGNFIIQSQKLFLRISFLISLTLKYRIQRFLYCSELSPAKAFLHGVCEFIVQSQPVFTTLQIPSLNDRENTRTVCYLRNRRTWIQFSLSSLTLEVTESQLFRAGVDLHPDTDGRALWSTRVWYRDTGLRWDT